MFDGKKILITGGTGSLGTELVIHILAKYKPAKLIVFSRDEAKQYHMQQKFQHESLRFFIGDVRDVDRLRMAFRDVDIVIHAAAPKHVPAAEYNPTECVKTNIMGATNVISAAIDQRVGKVVALSTDKAANPINLYGASKLASDKLFTAANNLAGTLPTRFCCVRYGNVLNSRGSAVEMFRNLIARGEKSIPVTDERMTRFWITIQQGVEFVSKCVQRMEGGEIFIPKIPASSVVTLVKALAPKAEYHLIGIRPGEKLHEVLCPRDSAPQTLEFKDFFTIKPSIVIQDGIDYSVTDLGERGKPVSADFEYNSQTNPEQLSVDQLRALLERAV